jgi:hypothetical protein
VTREHLQQARLAFIRALGLQPGVDTAHGTAAGDDGRGRGRDHDSAAPASARAPSQRRRRGGAR